MDVILVKNNVEENGTNLFLRRKMDSGGK